MFPQALSRAPSVPVKRRQLCACEALRVIFGAGRARPVSEGQAWCG